MPEAQSPTIDPKITPISNETTQQNDFVDRRKQSFEARVEQSRWLLKRHEDVLDSHDIKVPGNLKDSPDFLDNTLYFYHVHAEVMRRFTPDLRNGDIPEVLEHAIESSIHYTELQRRVKVAEDFHPKAHDPEKGLEFLTEKAFRREANEYLRKVARDPKHHRAGVAMSDINDFKLFNSIHNEKTGDEAIKNVALGVTRALRPEDPKGKIGGDEDVALIEERLVDEAATETRELPYDLHPAERMRRSVSETHDYNSPPVAITVGYSQLRPGEDLQAGLDRASDAKKVGNLIPAENPEPGKELKSIKNRAIEARIDLGEDIYEDITSGKGTLYIVVRDKDGYFAQLQRKQKDADQPDIVWDVVRPEGEKMVLSNARDFQPQTTS